MLVNRIVKDDAMGESQEQAKKSSQNVNVREITHMYIAKTRAKSTLQPHLKK